MPDINQGFTAPWGERGQIEYKPNWGQPIVDGQWRGTGAAQPATPMINPREVINTRLASLRSDFKRQANTLRESGLDADVHNRALAGLQNKYDQAKARETGTVHQLDQIQELVQAGGVSPDAGYEASVRLTMPREVADLMFPKPEAEPRGRFTPSEFSSYIREFQSRIESTMVKPWLARNYADPDALKEQYFSARAAFAYDTDMNTNEQKGFDLAWDQAIASNPKAMTTWKKALKEDPDLFTSRTYDTKLLEIAADKARGSISPMAKFLNKQKPLRKFGGAGAGMTYPYIPKRAQQPAAAAVPTATEDFSTMSDEELRRIVGGR